MQPLKSLPFLAGLLVSAHVASAQDVPFAPIAPEGGARGASEVSPDGAQVPPTMPAQYTADAVQPGPLQEGPVAPRVPSVGDRRERLHFDQDGVAHWARARRYKARAGADGFTYVPFLGSTASRNYPVAMGVSSVTVGGQPLAFDEVADVRRDGDAFLLDRGPVDVRYDLALDTVEQSFTIETGGAIGDLVVVLDVASELQGGAVGAGFRFAGPEGGVDYGAATAFDGAGRHVHVPAALDGGQLRLTVPAAFVAGAGGVVVIDPVFSTYQVFPNSSEVRDVDVAYDLGDDVFTYVFEDPWSATDNDIYLVAVSADNGTYEHGLYVDFTTRDFNDPEVAGLNAENMMLVVATNEIAGDDDEIHGRLYDVSAQSVQGASFVVGDTGGGLWSNARPDVGGNSSSTPGQRFLVTWERMFDSTGSTLPRFTTVDAAGNVGALGTVLQGGGGDLECTWVRCSESTGRPSTVNVWNVCFSYRDTGTGDEELRVAQLNADGTVASSVGTAVGSGLGASFETIDISDAIEVPGYDPTYLVVYDDFTFGDEDVTAVICRNGYSVRRVDINASEHANLSLNQNFPKVATTDEEFIVAYSEQSGGEWHTVTTALDLVEGSRLAISERRTDLGLADPGLGTDGSPGMASRFSGGLYGSRYIGIGWEVNDSNANTHSVEAVTYYASNPDAPAWQYCDGVANSTGERGFLRLEGTRSAFSSKTARVSSVPPQQFALLVCGDLFDHVPMAGGGQGTLCVGGNLGRYNGQIQQIDLAGQASFTIDPQMIPTGIGYFAASAGDRYNFQVWHRDFVGFQT